MYNLIITRKIIAPSPFLVKNQYLELAVSIAISEYRLVNATLLVQTVNSSLLMQTVNAQVYNTQFSYRIDIYTSVQSS